MLFGYLLPISYLVVTITLDLIVFVIALLLSEEDAFLGNSTRRRAGGRE